MSNRPFNKSLTLFIPGLMGPGKDVKAEVSPDTWWGGVSLPALNRLRKQALYKPAQTAGGQGQTPSRHGVIADLFALPVCEDQDLPVAAIGAQVDLPEASDRDGRFWMRADPVYLKADRDHLRFYDATVLDLSMDECLTLAQEINQVYEEDDWQLHVATAERWYLSLPAMPRIRSHAPDQVMGRIVDPFLPEGPEAKRWHAALTEIQMLMHMSAVNQQREAQGRFPVNSLWFWGAGLQPAVQTGQDGSVPLSCWADDPLARGLSHMVGGAVNGAAERYADIKLDLLREGLNLVVLEDLATPALYLDEGAWQQGLARLEQDWFAPILTALKAKTLNRLVLLADTGEQRALTRYDLRRFWRPWFNSD